MSRVKMKYIIVFILYIGGVCCSFSQTFRSGFDNRDFSSSGGQGQGNSYHSNVVNILHNGESVFLQGYINMYRATLDKRYLDQFIIHCKRVQERRDDNIQYVSSQLTGFQPNGAVVSLNACTPDNYQLNPSDQCIIQGVSQVPLNSKGWSCVEEPCSCLFDVQATVHSGEITYPMAQFVWYIMSDPDFMTLANEVLPVEAQTVPVCGGVTTINTYSEFASWLSCRIAETLEFHENEWRKLNYLGTGLAAPCDVPFIPGGAKDYGRYVPGDNYLNSQTSIGRVWALMYLVTGNPEYKCHVTDIAYWVRNQLEEYSVIVNGNSYPYYTWPYKWNGDCREDGGHAYLTMEFADICSRYYITDSYSGFQLFTPGDMQRFANTFAFKMYKEPLDFWTTTSGADGEQNLCIENNKSAAHYSFLAKYNPYIFQITSDYQAENAIYKPHVDGHLKQFSQLALLQSRNDIANSFNGDNFKFNPVAVRRGHSPGSNVYHIASGDLDNNGMQDLVSVDGSAGGQSVFYSFTPDICDNPNDFTAHNNYPGNCWLVAQSAPLGIINWKGLAAGNLDASTAPADHPGDELLAVESGGGVYLLKQTGGTPWNGTINHETVGTGLNWAGLTVSDFQPGYAGDEAVAITSLGALHFITYGSSGIQVSAPVTQTSIQNTVGICAGNFDFSDNRKQIAILDGTNDYISIYSYDAGLNKFALIYQYTGAGCCNLWTSITAGDLDGDGKDEIIVHRDVDGQMIVLKIKSGLVQPVYGEYFPVDQSIRAIATAPLRMSYGRDALLVFRNFDGQITIFNMEGHCPNTYVSNANINDSYAINNIYTNTDNNYVIDYHANNTLYVSDFKAGDVATSYNSQVKMTAGKKIVVSPGDGGSRVYSGSSFHAYIDNGLSCQEAIRVGRPPFPDPPSIEKGSLSNMQLKPSQLEVFPNPAQGSFTLVLDEKTGGANAILKMFDALGREVLVREIANARNLIDIQALPPGLYLVRVSSDTGEYISKIQVR